MDECIVRQVGEGTLISITVFSLLRCFMMTLPYCVRSRRFESLQRGNRWWYIHKRSSVLHYLILAPLFELLVTWGARVTDSIAPVAAEVELLWLAVLLSGCFMLMFSCFTRSGFRMAVHTVQIMQLPCFVAFLCERIVNTHIGGEISIIVGLIVCAIFEVFTVPDFFTVLVPALAKQTDADDDNDIDYDDDEEGEAVSPREIAMRSTDFHGEHSDDGMGLESHDLAEKASTRAVANLLVLLQQVDPSKMNVDELRAFVRRCKRKLESISQSSDSHSGAGLPVERGVYAGVEYTEGYLKLPIPANAAAANAAAAASTTMIMSGGGTSIISPMSTGPFTRYSSRRSVNTPEC